MISLGVKFLDPKRWQENMFHRYEKRILGVERKQVGKALAVLEREIKQTIKREFEGGATELASSYFIRPRVMRKGPSGLLEARVTSTLVYARVQDQGTGYLPGGAIRPKPPLKNLAIPLVKQLRKAGIWPRHYASRAGGNLTMGPISRAGNRLLVDANTGDLRYVLVPESRFRGKDYIPKALTRARPKIRGALSSVFRLAIGPVKRGRS